MKSRTNQPIYNDNGKLAQDMPNTSASDSGKVLGIDASGKVVPVSSGTKLYRHIISFNNAQEEVNFVTYTNVFEAGEDYTSLGGGVGTNEDGESVQIFYLQIRNGAHGKVIDYTGYNIDLEEMVFYHKEDIEDDTDTITEL